MSAANGNSPNALVGHLDSVICGDNAEVMATWPDACIDLVVTSPPYDNAREYGGHGRHACSCMINVKGGA